jgi:hypothetical protein
MPPGVWPGSCLVARMVSALRAFLTPASLPWAERTLDPVLLA